MIDFMMSLKIFKNQSVEQIEKIMGLFLRIKIKKAKICVYK
jgi:hypothetical protein